MSEPILSREEVEDIFASAGVDFYSSGQVEGDAEDFYKGVAALESALLEKLRGEPVAWLVEEGRTFRDKVFIGELQANNSIAERNDGARKTPLYTLKGQS
ncbi:hypothetical protein WT41_01540 [Burkholderia territorii]|uniref:hypothetical protein n=1 Tax=Burkholderia territorii TaxID=1503055 RepID=UPI0007564D2D|nr:hypothetical protein [Burkholderia territorii]KWA35759.1 hypothetical protein WT41_01540 [Burkholderia territorii]